MWLGFLLVACVCSNFGNKHGSTDELIVCFYMCTRFDDRLLHVIKG